MRKRGIVILIAAVLTASVPATVLADQLVGQVVEIGNEVSEEPDDAEEELEITEESMVQETDTDETSPGDVGIVESKPEEPEEYFTDVEEETMEKDAADVEEMKPEETETADKETEEMESEEAKSEVPEETVSEEDAVLIEEAKKEEKEPEPEAAEKKEPVKEPVVLNEPEEMPEIGTKEFTQWFKRNCKEDFLWDMLADYVDDEVFFSWAVENDRLYYKAFQSYKKALEKAEMLEEVEIQDGEETDVEEAALPEEDVEELS